MGSTLHDVARVAGVSIKTVSNVINDYPHVRPLTRAKVQAAIAELDYRPNLSARGLRSGRTGVIGLTVPKLRENYFAELADAVIQAAQERGLGVVVDQTNELRETEIQAITGGRLRFIDGLLFSPVSLGQDDAHLLDVDFPLVLLGERIFDGPTDHVTMHNTSSAEAAVEHLLGIGRRRIAAVGATSERPEAASSANLRLQGYRRALERAGIPFDPQLVRRADKWTRQAGATATRALLSDGVEFDAVFALNDTLGLGVLRALGEAGVHVPDDVAVIGFDNVEESQFSVPSMSTVDPGRLEIARLAVDMLLERINEKGERIPPRTVRPAFRVVRRESTGFPDQVEGPS
ncbi:LacI family DNA-binding transcriptional regulator [Microbacterium rhizosphaerae]|uniref:LacI family DNA-binding transcriptional regulator n=1 Tax=Microbacterium rhizosphaerae TaxID=1678237 RepID=A0ABZ0SSX3_9MICO|nr:LacI family DNA-binding transcriptional regulator [Microbacterium rhizosphaerae]WPR90367.1 LacI family DNA-binding transcriptional regulator [Microbacterium rhizosphaerae]